LYGWSSKVVVVLVWSLKYTDCMGGGGLHIFFICPNPSECGLWWVPNHACNK
jgi:hypothetical protein